MNWYPGRTNAKKNPPIFERLIAGTHELTHVFIRPVCWCKRCSVNWRDITRGNGWQTVSNLEPTIRRGMLRSGMTSQAFLEHEMPWYEAFYSCGKSLNRNSLSVGFTVASNDIRWVHDYMNMVDRDAKPPWFVLISNRDVPQLIQNRIQPAKLS